MSDELDPASLIVHAGRPLVEADAPLNEPVVFSSTYVAGGPAGYGRFGNSTWSAFEGVLGELEGGHALVLASGMAACAIVFDLVPVGGKVVAPVHAYNGVTGLLDRQASEGRITLQRVDIADTDAVIAALPGAALLWAESPTNPAMEVADLPAICAAAKAQDVLVAVDNTFATPLLQKPLDLGADIVVHSVTKFLAGHSDVLLGAVVAKDQETYDALALRRKTQGAIAGPMEVWLALRGMRTLALRMDKAQENAQYLVERLKAHPKVSRVRYPGLPDDPGHERAAKQMRGFGAIIAIEVAGGAEEAQRVTESTELWIHATSLGGVESMLERRRRWPTEPDTIPDNLIRLSVGIEHSEDLWQDLQRALG
ncbi:trans-sulfuration enzyme family protein [Kribbella deserti]|uniref:Trans-sulfuration enzyme family protein n=1 Tax=Kribbella deserti TaxID=1926257 RepID=A0ABV6QV08_9ACTN